MIKRALVLTLAVAAAVPLVAQRSAQLPSSVRLYVIDCGKLESTDPGRFDLKREEMATTDMSVGCYLVAHPRGTLMWDTGAVPDAMLQSDTGPTRHRLALPNGQERFVTTVKPLAAQVASTGHAAGDITYLAVSHYHYDHTANSNLFARATWLVRKVERDAMFGPKASELTVPANYSARDKSKTTIIERDDHDVFGDGSVVIKSAPGHTPGHQVLFLKLAKTGAVVLSGDLYHYPEERALKRIPTFDTDREQTRASRASLDGFLQKSGAQLWIQHDIKAFTALKKAFGDHYLYAGLGTSLSLSNPH